MPTALPSSRGGDRRVIPRRATGSVMGPGRRVERAERRGVSEVASTVFSGSSNTSGLSPPRSDGDACTRCGVAPAALAEDLLPGEHAEPDTPGGLGGGLPGRHVRPEPALLRAGQPRFAGHATPHFGFRCCAELAPPLGAEPAGFRGRSAPGSGPWRSLLGAEPGGFRGRSAPGLGVCTRRGGGTAGFRGRSAPGSGVCTRRGGGTGHIGAQSHRRGCKPPNRVHSCRPGGPLSPRGGCKPPQRVHSRATGRRHTSPSPSPTPAPAPAPRRAAAPPPRGPGFSR